jgi:hypothetical protein
MDSLPCLTNPLFPSQLSLSLYEQRLSYTTTPHECTAVSRSPFVDLPCLDQRRKFADPIRPLAVQNKSLRSFLKQTTALFVH